MNSIFAAEQEIVDLESAALRRWSQGDPDGFLQLCAEDVSYFDPFHEHRLDGRQALSALYDSLRGQVRLESFEMIDPRVTVVGDVALLTFHLKSVGEQVNHWNATEVFRRDGPAWKIIHSHWSITKPELLEPPV